MRRGKVHRFLMAFFICSNVFFNAGAQVIRHTYRFDGTFSASEPDCGPDIKQVKAGGPCIAGNIAGAFVSDTLPQCLSRRTVYHTNLHWGLMYPNTDGKISTTYTIHIYVKNTSWGNAPWARIIDFSSTADKDVGVYYQRILNNSCLQFWPSNVVGDCPFFSLNTYYLLSFTRNGATGIIDVYVNGKLFTSYNDRQNDYVAASGNPIYIYRDDGGLYPCESGEANLAYLSFSNQYSLQAEITSVYNNICRIAKVNTADFDFSPTVSCGINKNTTVTYTGNITSPGTDYAFNWDWDGGTVVSGTGMGPYIVHWNTTGVKNVVLTITGGACTSPVTKIRQITVGNLGVSTIIQPGNCTGNNNGTITVNASGGAPPYQYSLDGLTYQSSNIFTVPTGSYAVVVKDANNCVDNAAVNVTSINNLVLQTRADTSVCQGKSVKLFTSGNATSYSWQPVTGLDDANSRDPLATPAATTDYIVTATSGGCTKKDTVRIIVTSPVIVSTSSLPATCTGNNSGTITVNASGGAPPYQYSLDGLTYQSSNIFTVPTGPYAVLVKDANNCVDNAAVNVTSINNLVLQTRADTSVCQGKSVKLFTSGNATSYSWQPVTGLDDANSRDPLATPAATTDYIVTATSGGCTKKDTVRIIVTSPVIVSTSSLPATCTGNNNGTITVNASGGAPPYQYSLDGLTYQSSNIFIVPTGPYAVVVKDANNCLGNAAVNLTSINDLVLQTRADTSVCQGKSVKLFTSGNATSYLWQPVTGLDNANSRDPLATPASTTDYIVTATSGGCTKKDTVRIIVTSPVIVSTSSLPGTCTGNNNGTITVNASGGAPPYQYSLDGLTYQSSNIFIVPTGPYAVVVKDANNCVGNAAANAPSINDLVLQSRADTAVCQTQPVKLFTNSNATVFAWQPASGLDNPNVKDPVATPAATTDYIVTATSGGCTKKDTVRIVVTQSITVTATADTTVAPGVPFQLMSYSPQLNNVPGVSYLWLPSTGLNNPNIADPIVILSTDQFYTVEIKSAEGCKGSSSVNIKVLKGDDIYVPNGFTPNKDGRNDLLKPIAIGIRSFKYFKVFNRWGKLIFSTNSLNLGWNGEINGAEQSAGTFVWMVEGVSTDGKRIFKKGTTVLIR